MTQETERDGDVQPAIAEVAAQPLPDDLMELADRHGEAFRRVCARSVKNAQACLEFGASLAKAKARCGRGKWLPFLERAGIPRRTASRLMRVSRSGMDAETLAGKGIRLADEDMARPGKPAKGADLEDDPTSNETRSQVFRSLHTKLREAANEGRGIRLQPRDVSALVARLSRPRPRAGNGSDDTFHSTGFVKRALRRQRPRRQMIRLLERLYDAHPGFLSAEEMYDAADCSELQFADLMDEFGRGIADTDGYSIRRHFFDWHLYDETDDVWECRLPDTVRRALEEEFPNNFLAPDNDMDEPGSTAGSDENPS